MNPDQVSPVPPVPEFESAAPQPPAGPSRLKKIARVLGVLVLLAILVVIGFFTFVNYLVGNSRSDWEADKGNGPTGNYARDVYLEAQLRAAEAARRASEN